MLIEESVHRERRNAVNFETEEQAAEEQEHRQDIPSLLSDHELMRRLAEGDRDALQPLVCRHQERVLALAYRFLGNWDAAEDVGQDAFIRVLESARNYLPTAKFSTWLYRIVSNLCWDRRRRAARESGSRRAESAEQQAEDAAERLEQSDRRQKVRRAVAQLPDRQRLTLILHRYHEMSHAEIACATGWSVGAVESCLVRAYRHLRETLAELRET